MSDVHQTPRRGLPTLGRRGGGWVAVQVALIVAILLSALTGRGWPNMLEPLAYALGGVALVGGATLLLAGGFRLGNALTPFPAPRESGDLRTTGVYGLVRHPMYGGGLLIGLGWAIVFATPTGLGLTVLLAAFADLKARREEVWLEQTHPEYSDYRRRTPHRFIPLVW
jgi:protein-S-isoprenylcysteine O-methyltransferase Ste14